MGPEGAGQTIKIDTVRELTDWLQLTADRGSYKLALVDSADQMTHSAANSLLKTLEEPGGSALIILVSDQPARLPATVLSRCQLITLRLQDRAAALAWLEGQVADPSAALTRANGAPLQALQEASADWQDAEATLRRAWHDLFLHRASIDRIVKSLEKLPPARSLRRFSQWTAAAARMRLSSMPGETAPAGVPRQSETTGSAIVPGRMAASRPEVSTPAPYLADQADESLVSRVQHCLSTDDWFTLHDRIGRLYRIDSTSFKAQAVLEGLMAQIRADIDSAR